MRLWVVFAVGLALVAGGLIGAAVALTLSGDDDGERGRPDVEGPPVVCALEECYQRDRTVARPAVGEACLAGASGSALWTRVGESINGAVVYSCGPVE
jgi:hypothetical protein